MKMVLPWLVRSACRAGTRDFCSALAALVGPVQNIVFLTEQYFHSCVPIAQQAGQEAMLGRTFGEPLKTFSDLLHCLLKTWRIENYLFCRNLQNITSVSQHVQHRKLHMLVPLKGNVTARFRITRKKYYSKLSMVLDRP